MNRFKRIAIGWLRRFLHAATDGYYPATVIVEVVYGSVIGVAGNGDVIGGGSVATVSGIDSTGWVEGMPGVGVVDGAFTTGTVSGAPQYSTTYGVLETGTVKGA